MINEKKIRETAKAYRRLFLNEAGGLKPDAIIVLEDMMSFACFFVDKPMSGLDQLALVEGARSMVRSVLRKSGAESQMLKRLLEGDNHE